MRTRRTTTVPLLVALVATLLGPSAPAAAATPDPSVVGISPPAGDVVRAGDVLIAGILISSTGFRDVTVTVDGSTVAAQVRSIDSSTQKFSATVPLADGSHIAGVTFTDGNGQQVRRMWRFAASDLRLRRLAGEGRVATAVALSRDTFPDDRHALGAVLATAGDFPDALAAAPVARSVGGPLLLTAADGLSAEAAAELQRVLAPVATVTLMGGTKALSAQVEADVRELGFDVERIAGETREDTAVKAARAHLSGSDTVVVAAAATFADALSAAAPAARDGMPILLTPQAGLPPEVTSYLGDHEVTRAIVVGGKTAVSDAVVTQLRDRVGAVERLAGPDRFSTSLAVLDRFYDAPTAVSVASGLGFADGLAGGAHAAAAGQPLLLAHTSGVPETVVHRMTELPLEAVDLYGGFAAMDRRVDRAALRFDVNAPDGPRVLSQHPAPATRVSDLDTVEITFDRYLSPDATSVLVTLDGREWFGTPGHGDYTDTVVFRPGELPIPPDRGVDHDVDVYVLTYDGQRWHHLHWHFHLRREQVSRGDSGSDVRVIQQRLLDLGYWLPGVDGKYGYMTAQAVMAFQKYEGLSRTGTADKTTLDRLDVAARPAPRSPRAGRWVEIDKSRQVMLFGLDGRVQWAMNTSTGTEKTYTRPDGSTGYAHTPEGWFTFFRQIDGMREAELGQMWRPKYFTDAGHAIHGSTSVPAYPASHGCARLAYPAIDYVWSAGLAPIGTKVHVYR